MPHSPLPTSGVGNVGLRRPRRVAIASPRVAWRLRHYSYTILHLRWKKSAQPRIKFSPQPLAWRNPCATRMKFLIAKNTCAKKSLRPAHEISTRNNTLADGNGHPCAIILNWINKLRITAYNNNINHTSSTLNLNYRDYPAATKQN
jgi:hypothetical protein